MSPGVVAYPLDSVKRRMMMTAGEEVRYGHLMIMMMMMMMMIVMMMTMMMMIVMMMTMMMIDTYFLFYTLTCS